MPARRRTAKSCSRNWTGMSRRRASSPIGTGPGPPARASSVRARDAEGDLVVIESIGRGRCYDSARSAVRVDALGALALLLGGRLLLPRPGRELLGLGLCLQRARLVALGLPALALGHRAPVLG